MRRHIIAVYELADELTLNRNELLVLLALAAHADTHGGCWPSLPRIAHAARISRSTAIRTLERLADKSRRLIEVKRVRRDRVNQVNYYRLARAIQAAAEPPEGGWCHPDTTPHQNEGGVVSPRHQGSSTMTPEVLPLKYDKPQKQEKDLSKTETKPSPSQAQVESTTPACVRARAENGSGKAPSEINTEQAKDLAATRQRIVELRALLNRRCQFTLPILLKSTAILRAWADAGVDALDLDAAIDAAEVALGGSTMHSPGYLTGFLERIAADKKARRAASTPGSEKAQPSNNNRARSVPHDKQTEEDFDAWIDAADPEPQPEPRPHPGLVRH